MAYGGMVHALEEIHRLLKPEGRLVDIHPVAEPTPVEIHHRGRIIPVGDLTVRQWCRDFEEADGALEEILDRGVFVVEHERVFDATTYYDSVDELRAELRESLDRFARDEASIREAVPHIDAIVDGAGYLMGPVAEDAELALRERNHIRRLRPA